ncbi:DNA integrity scanning diadenylate cyclase DisA [Nocardia bovistercoris]|uniref:DNA integrity scanning protein DisA n=1 Tax=Nocardia bovistercoris TaxID=2785916 RepID=A0A931N465_9NOCA|nr:DNA integrity scanning diadenylate cyclase DisA [Nocardia bovistercoris]MBH0778534.1 DNA integrity scanning protein DisA [Nocardia bovistercoris]
MGKQTRSRPEAAATEAAALRDAIVRLAPGTELRDGIERILRGHTGALIVLGHDESVESICDGGFELNVEFAPTRLRELAKMDGAVVLSDDGARIVRANVHLVPDPALPTVETGTRHKAAERTATQTGAAVISVSESMSVATVYVGGSRHIVQPSATILARANQALGTLERYKVRLDEVNRRLARGELEDQVSLRDALTVAQRLEMVRRIAEEIDRDVLELGTDGRQLALQLEELVGDSTWLRELLVRDYLRTEPAAAAVDRAMERLDALTDSELLDLTNLAGPLGYPAGIEALDEPMRPRGYRLLTRIPRLQFDRVEALVRAFGSLRGLLAATASDLQSVPGIGATRAAQIREALSRSAEAGLDGPYERS